jgi:DNA invertase Pin-like site-specific DNA recombinase
MKAGYLRESAGSPGILELQKAALDARCDQIYSDPVDSKGAGLVAAVQALKSGDTLFVTKLDRLGKPIKGVVDFIHSLESSGVTFVAIEDGIDTGTPEGRTVVKILTNLVLMDRSLNSERTNRSLQIAKAKGRTGGRPPALSEDQVNEAKKLISSGMPVRAVAKLIGSNHATLYRHIGAKPVEPSKSD